MQQFDPNIPGFLEGDVATVAIHSPAGFPSPPALGNLVVDPTKPFEIETKWRLEGSLVGIWLATGGQWRVQAYAESIGAGPERLIGTATVAVAPGVVNPSLAEYDATITVAPGTLPEHDPNGANPNSGLYKLAVSVFRNGPVPGPYDLIGYHEGPIVMVENPA